MWVTVELWCTGSAAQVGPSRGCGGRCFFFLKKKYLDPPHFDLHLFLRRTQGSHLKEMLKPSLLKPFAILGPSWCMVAFTRSRGQWCGLCVVSVSRCFASEIRRTIACGHLFTGDFVFCLSQVHKWSSRLRRQSRGCHLLCS